MLTSLHVVLHKNHVVVEKGSNAFIHYALLTYFKFEPNAHHATVVCRRTALRYKLLAQGEEECVTLMWAFEVATHSQLHLMLSGLWGSVGSTTGEGREGWKEGGEQQQGCWWFLWLWAVFGCPWAAMPALAPAQIPVVIISTRLPAAARDRKSLFIPYVRVCVCVRGSAFALSLSLSLSLCVNVCRKVGGRGVWKKSWIILTEKEVWELDLPAEVPLKGNEEVLLSKRGLSSNANDAVMSELNKITLLNVSLPNL